MSDSGEPEVCTTCGDVATALEVVEVDEAGGLARCSDRSDRQQTVEIGLVLPVEAGDRLLVHAGTAIARLDEQPEGRDRAEHARRPERSSGQAVPEHSAGEGRV